MMRNILMLAMVAAAAVTGTGWQANAAPVRNTIIEYSDADTPTYTRRTVLSETDNYIDLRTGNVVRIRWDAANNAYVREDLLPLEVYVNSVTRDTFYGAQAVLVNNALVRDAAGVYAVDPNWVGPNGESYKVKTVDGAMKIKDNENELKMKEGDTKVKGNENELKMKEGDAKLKSNESELKTKSGDARIKDNSNEQKHKTTDGGKVKGNDRETKIKTDDSKTKINNRTGNVKTKAK